MAPTGKNLGVHVKTQPPTPMGKCLSQKLWLTQQGVFLLTVGDPASCTLTNTPPMPKSLPGDPSSFLSWFFFWSVSRGYDFIEVIDCSHMQIIICRGSGVPDTFSSPSSAEGKPSAPSTKVAGCHGNPAGWSQQGRIPSVSALNWSRDVNQVVQPVWAAVPSSTSPGDGKTDGPIPQNQYPRGSIRRMNLGTGPPPRAGRPPTRTPVGLRG